MKTRKSLRWFIAVLLICVSTDESHGEKEATENLGLARWETFEATLTHYRSLLQSGVNRNEDIRREIEEYIKADSKAQIESLERFYSGRLMLLVTQTKRDTPALRESEFEGMIASRLDQLTSTLQGAHADLPDSSSLSDRVEVLIETAGEMKNVFQSWRIGHGLTNSPEELKKENKAEMATPRKPSD